MDWIIGSFVGYSDVIIVVAPMDIPFGGSKQSATKLQEAANSGDRVRNYRTFQLETPEVQ